MLFSLLPLKVANFSFINGCNQSPLRLPMLQDHKLLTLCWQLFSGYGWEFVLYVNDYKRNQHIKNRQWPTKFNIFQLVVGYQNTIINSDTWQVELRLEAMDLAKAVETCTLTVTCKCFASQDTAPQFVQGVWNRTEQFLKSESGPLVGYAHLLITLITLCKMWARIALMTSQIGILS